MPSCPQCSGAVEPGDAYCISCGARLDSSGRSAPIPLSEVHWRAPSWPAWVDVALLSILGGIVFFLISCNYQSGDNYWRGDIVAALQGAALYGLLVATAAALSLGIDRLAALGTFFLFCVLALLSQVVAVVALDAAMPAWYAPERGSQFSISILLSLLFVLGLAAWLFGSRGTDAARLAQPSIDFVVLALAALIVVFGAYALLRDPVRNFAATAFDCRNLECDYWYGVTLESLMYGLLMGASVAAVDALRGRCSMRTLGGQVLEHASIIVAVSVVSYAFNLVVLKEVVQSSSEMMTIVENFQGLVLVGGIVLVTLLLAAARKRVA